MHPCVRCVIINCGSDAKHRGPKNAAPAIERAQGRLTVLGWEADGQLISDARSESDGLAPTAWPEHS